MVSQKMRDMEKGRRLFIRRGFGSALFLATLGRGGGAWGQTSDGLSPSAQEDFRAFLDTLIPADTTPAASQLKVDRAILFRAAKIANYPQLLALGCQWLAAQSNYSFSRSFSVLSAKQKDLVVSAAERSAKNSVQRLFFERVLGDALEIYYGMPEAWRGLGLPGPPQPAGYPDFALSMAGAA